MIATVDGTTILAQLRQHCFHEYGETIIRVCQSADFSKGSQTMASSWCLPDDEPSSTHAKKKDIPPSSRGHSHASDTKGTSAREEEEEEDMPLLELVSDIESSHTSENPIQEIVPKAFREHLLLGTLGGKEVRTLCEKMVSQNTCSSIYSARLYTVPFDENAPADENNFNFRVAIKNSLLYNKACNVPLLVNFRARCHNPWVVELFAGYIDAASIPVLGGAVVTSVLEYSYYGSLMNLLKVKEQFTEEQTRCVLEDVLKAFQFLHEEVGVCHNDVKPHNILIFDNHKTPFSYATNYEKEVDMREHFILNFDRNDYKFKIADFEALDRISPIEEAWGRPPSFENFFGTYLYVSPEYCLGVSGSATNDVWSLGIMTFQLVTGKVPWLPTESLCSHIIVNSFRSKYGNIDNLLRADKDGNTEHMDISGSNNENRNSINAPNNPQNKRDDLDFTANSANNAFAHFGPDLSELDLPIYSDEIRDFIRGCLIQNPLLRLPMSALRNHPFMKR